MIGRCGEGLGAWIAAVCVACHEGVDGASAGPARGFQQITDDVEQLGVVARCHASGSVFLSRSQRLFDALAVQVWSVLLVRAHDVICQPVLEKAHHVKGQGGRRAGLIFLLNIRHLLA